MDSCQEIAKENYFNSSLGYKLVIGDSRTELSLWRFPMFFGTSPLFLKLLQLSEVSIFNEQ